jgi:hypothetical protein
MADSKADDVYSNEETIARREAALKRMLSTPHKPHQPKGAGDSSKRGKRAASEPSS